MTLQEKIRPGYRHSEIGTIPEDWAVRPLSELTDPERPIGYGIVQTGPSVHGGIPCVRVLDLVNGRISRSNLITTSKEISQSYKRTLLRQDDLVIALRGKVGAVAKVDAALEGANLTRGVALLSKSSRYAPDYLLQYLSSSIGQALIEKNFNGSALQEIPIASLRKLPIAVPTDSEQNAIAEALSDADARIAALEAPLAKKRDLKQAAMQQLLTGKTRLPGFSGDWEVKRLGELLDYEQPTKYLVQSAEYDESYDIPVLTAGKSFYLGRTNENHGVCRNLPVIIFDDFTTATQFVNFPFKAKSSAMKLLRPRDRNTDIKLVYALMQGIKFTMSDHKRYWISEYQKIELPFPGPEEQAAIAQILSDMDAELAALEAEAEKARGIKQGMMQNLLTGKVRLV